MTVFCVMFSVNFTSKLYRVVSSGFVHTMSQRVMAMTDDTANTNHNSVLNSLYIFAHPQIYVLRNG